MRPHAIVSFTPCTTLFIFVLCHVITYANGGNTRKQCPDYHLKGHILQMTDFRLRTQHTVSVTDSTELWEFSACCRFSENGKILLSVSWAQPEYSEAPSKQRRTVTVTSCSKTLKGALAAGAELWYSGLLDLSAGTGHTAEHSCTMAWWEKRD